MHARLAGLKSVHARTEKNGMRTALLILTAIAGIVLCGVAVAWARSDEPGRLACPLTGDARCRDRACALGNTERALRDALTRAGEAAAALR